MNATQRFGNFLFILTVLLASVGRVSAQTPDAVQYFPETGHTVEGEFLRFYRKATHPEIVYGLPITEQFRSRDGKTVQYFQRARFEMRNNAFGKETVQLTPLGQFNYEAGSHTLNIDNPSACRSFQTGYQVCFAFLEFYKANGDEAQFGKPISPFEFRENLIVQYFERARFEWRADRPEGQRVVLTDLGRYYFDRLREDLVQLQPIRPLDATISSILSIHARAFVRNAMTESSGQQTVYVIVQSQTNQPVAGANGKATIHFTDDTQVDYFFTTNTTGLGSVSFRFENQEPGQLVPIEIVVTYQGLSSKTSTSFRIWY